MSVVSFEFIDNSEEILHAMREQIVAGLTACGIAAEGHAKANLTASGRVDEGTLRNSISYAVKEDENAVYIGSNIEYAPYVEFGTGIYYPGGRRTPWYYKDRDGNWHKTSGMESKPYLKPAVTDHVKQYRALIEDALKD